MLVAFGMLSREYETPMHMFDIFKGKLLELDAESSHYDERNKEALNRDKQDDDKSNTVCPDAKEGKNISSKAVKRLVPMSLA